MSKLYKLFLFSCLILAISASNCTSVIIPGCTTYNLSSTYSDCPCTTCSGSPPLHLFTSGAACCLVATDTHCNKCNSSFQCISCIPTYGVCSDLSCRPCNNYVTNCQYCDDCSICTICLSPYFLKANHCVDCTYFDNHCLNCTNSSCTACINGSYVASNNSCISCSTLTPNCSNCNNTICT